MWGGLALIGAGAVWVVPDYMMSASYADVAAEAKLDETESKPNKADKDSKDKAEDIGANKDAQSVGGIDWNYLKSVNPASSAWISVPNKGIDFPVMQGSDNDYYLHHDMRGRPGYGGVFLDYRCDPNGRNAIVYGHTLIGGGMFTPLGRADEPGQLSTIGPVVYTTPDAGAIEFTPIATLHVRPSFQDVQAFGWDIGEQEFEAAQRAVARDRAEAGEWTLELPAGEKPEGNYMIDWFFVEDAYVTIDGEKREVSRYYLTASAPESAVIRRGEKAAWRDWLVALVEQSTQVSADVTERIAQADRSLVLSCCSWPFDSHRTLTVCVA